MKKVLIAAIMLLTVVAGCVSFSPPVIIEFSVNPGSIEQGNSSTLIWNVTGANSVIINPGIGNVAVAGTYTISPTTTSTYVLTAINGAGTVTASTVLTVTAPPKPPLINSFSANPAVISIGDTAILSWQVEGASTITISPGIGSVPASGQQSISPAASTTYVLSATNNSGSVTATTVVTVNPLTKPPVIVDFSASPSTVVQGESTTLYWNVTGTDNVFIDNGIGNVPPVGSQAISPGFFSTYTLTASNSAGTVTRSVDVQVWYPSPYPGPFPPFNNLPSIISFDINPPIVSAGTSTTMTWQVNGADSVFINGIGSVAATGSMAITPGSTSVYTLTATNTFGSVNATATVIVSSSSGAPVITSFSVTPTSIQSGQSATLQWSVNGASAISIDHGIGGVALAGSRSVSPTSSTTYTITASNTSGMVQHSVTLTVTPSMAPPVIVKFVASPGNINPGKSSTLIWDVSGATSVSIDHGIGTVAPSGSMLVSPSTVTTYTLSATNAAGTVVATTKVTVIGGTND